MELIGIPIMIIIGDKSTEDNKVEVKVRLEEKTERVSPQDIIQKLSEIS
jgi:prolyl-tRNA synthetase